MNEKTDSQLLEAARAGEERALDELLRRHQGQVFRFGMRMCRNREDAKDVAQETLLAMVRGVDDFRGASSLSTWLYTIARNACIKKRRTGKYAPEQVTSLATADAASIADATGDPEESAAARQVGQALERAIADLEPIYREVLVLRDVEGLSTAEVAEVIGVSPQAVKTRLHRARLAVRERVAPLLGIQGGKPGGKPCRDVLSIYSQYLEGEVSQKVCAEMQSHLDGCTGCRQTCQSLRDTLAVCRAAGRSSGVPADVQLSVKTALRRFLGQD